MYLKSFNPKSSGLRWKKKIINFNKLDCHLKYFFRKKKNLAGRNFSGKTVIYTKLSKRYNNFFIFFDEKRLWSKQTSCLISLKKFNDNFFLGLIKFLNGSISYIKIPHGVFLGSFFKTSIFPIKVFKSLTLGYKVLLRSLKKYFLIYDLSLSSFSKPKISKSGGTYCQILNINNDLNLCSVKLPSQKKLIVSLDCFGTLGRVSNIFKKFEYKTTAGSNINIGKKQSVRGVAMNPVDHPHGGRTKTSKPEVSPWGWVTKHSH